MKYEIEVFQDIHLLKMKLQSVLLFGNTSIPEKKNSFDNLC
jgi:hypothetical protein